MNTNFNFFSIFPVQIRAKKKKNRKLFKSKRTKKERTAAI